MFTVVLTRDRFSIFRDLYLGTSEKRNLQLFIGAVRNSKGDHPSKQMCRPPTPAQTAEHQFYFADYRISYLRLRYLKTKQALFGGLESMEILNLSSHLSLDRKVTTISKLLIDKFKS